MSDGESWYVYSLIDPRDGCPRYVGATADPSERREAHINHPHSEPIRGWVSNLKDDGKEPEMDILVECSASNLSAKEEAVIEAYSSQYDLLNGQSKSGYHPRKAVETSQVASREELKEEIDGLKQRKEELLHIAWDKEGKIRKMEENGEDDVDLDELREAVRDAREAYEDVDGNGVDDAIARLEELTGVDDG